MKNVQTTKLSRLAITNLVQQIASTANTSFKYVPYMFPYRHTLTHKKITLTLNSTKEGLAKF